MYPLTEEQAFRVYDILLDFGARDDPYERQGFVFHQTTGEGCREYRFGGIGPGGKFWNSAGRWYVNIYEEARTPERDAQVEACNARLAALQAEF